MRYQDISLTNSASVGQIHTKWADNNYSEMISQINGLKSNDVVLTAEAINYVTALINALENQDDPTFKANVIKVQSTPPAGMTSGQIYFKTD